jgi:aryl-alcohol dehydrogenase-like predicted oxidoreductase
VQTRRIGSLNVSVVGLGCNNFGGRIDFDASKAVIDAALGAGINFFDTADMYGGSHSEEFVGRALGARRRDVIIATKFGLPVNEHPGGARPEYVRQAAEASLRRLGTDYIDLYQLHRPDPTVPIADTLGALNALVQAGKVREIGCSNFTVDQLRAAETAPPPGASHFVSVQNEYSLFHRDPEAGVLAECERAHLAFLPYFPLANGLLTGKYRRGQPAPQGTRIGPNGWFPDMLTSDKLNAIETLTQFAESRHHTLLELAFAWLLAHGVVASVIAGATKPAQVTANAAAANFQLFPADLAAIDQLSLQPA